MGPDAPTATTFEAAAAERGIPFKTVSCADAGLLALYERPLALIRPDQHVAWRGDSEPDDPGAVLDTVTGR